MIEWHWNLYEVIWMLLALTGVVLGLYNLVMSALDLRALGRLTNGRRMIAKSAMIRDFLRVAVAGLAVAGGIAGGLREGDPRNTLGALAFIGALLVAVLFSGYDARVRILLLRENGDHID